MAKFTSPGIYLEPLQPVLLQGHLLRSDIVGFMGYARRGPAALPVRVESWPQFIAIFGSPLTNGHLGFAVKAFFENGGVTCYIHRLVDSQAAAAGHALARVDGQLGWHLFAAFRPADVMATADAVADEQTTRPDPTLVQHIPPGQARQPVPNPGTWGNDLTVSLQRSSLLNTRITGLFNQGFSCWLDSLVGLEAHSTVEVSQQAADGAGTLRKIVAIDSIDPLRQSVTWKQSLLPDFSAHRPLRLDTVEFDLTLYHEHRQVEKFPSLALQPQHSRSLYRVLAEQSQYVSVLPEQPLTDPNNPEHWPQALHRAPLTGGADGLAQIGTRQYLEALSTLAKIDDIGIVAAPDLVLRSQIEVPPVHVTPPSQDCHALLAPHRGLIVGLVDDGSQPLAGVTVTDVGSGSTVVSGSDGRFVLSNLELALRTLRLSKAGFTSVERQVFSSTSSSETHAFALAPLALPRSLDDSEIMQVQQAMGNPVHLGAYRIALLDPPRAKMRIDEIRSWRAQVGDSARIALFYPWLEAPPISEAGQTLQTMPPCGHVAGLLAHTDVHKGPQQPPANIKMRFVKRLLHHCQDAEHGLVNGEGINLIRNLPGQGIRIMGARTLSSDAQWRYLNVRRLVFALEKTLERNLQWAVFENNTTLLRQALTLSANILLDQLWRAGALAGQSPQAAYRVKCDDDNNPASQRDQGKLLIEVAIAPSVPFEFIYLRFGKALDAIEVTE